MKIPYDTPNKFPLRNPFAPALTSEARVPKLMPQVLGSWDMTVTFVVSMCMATSTTAAVAGGSATLLYILLAGLTFFLPCLIVTAQLGSMFPHEGALYNWTHHAMGGYWSFFSSFCAWFPSIFISSNMAYLFISYAQMLLHFSLTSPLQQGLATSTILLVASVISTRRLRRVQSLMNILVILLLISTILIEQAAILWFVMGHHSATSFGNVSTWKLKPENFSLFGILVFAFIGAERPLNLAGEMRGRRVIRRHLLWGGMLIFVLYLTNTFAVLSVEGPQAAANPLAMVTIVTNTLGQPFGTITTLCLMGSLFAAMLAYNSIFARLLFVVSIDHRLLGALHKLNKRQVPTNALLFQTLLAITFTLLIFVIAPLITAGASPGSAQGTGQGLALSAPTVDMLNDFSVAVYSVIQAAVSLIWIISTLFLFVDLLCCYVRDRRGFRQRRILPIPLLLFCTFIGMVSSTLTIITTLLFSWTPLIPNTDWIFLLGSLTMTFLVIATLSSMIAHSEAAWQEIRNVLLDTEKRRVPPKKLRP
jgi:amino acid transporter